MILLQQMLVLFIIMIIGYVCGKIKVINDNGAKTLSWIVVNISNPALIISASINGNGTIKGKELLMVFTLSIAVYIVLFILAIAIPYILRAQKKDFGIYKVMTIFSNIGFMGFPLISAMYGSEALLYASLFLFPYNILIYTYGIKTMKKQKDDSGKPAILKILNAGVISCVISVILYFVDISMPAFVNNTVSVLSNLTAPLSMLVIGQSMIHIRFKDVVTDVRLLAFSVIKLLVIPIAGLFVLKLFISNEIILGVCMVMLATPVGSMTAMLAQQCDGDYELASKGVALTTILSVGTIPLVSFLMLR